MAITTLDGVIAGMQPPVDYMKVAAGTQVISRFYTPFYGAGYPAAAAAPTPGMAGEALTTYAGQLPFVNGASDQYLARWSVGFDRTGVGLLCDRLWHNSGIDVTSTAPQTVNSVAWPARDHNGATAGDGIQVGLEVSTITGAGVGGAVTISYTNQAGTAGRTGTVRVNAAAAMIVGTILDFTLAAGDVGIRSVESITIPATMTSGTVHLVAYRVLARQTVTVDRQEVAVDALTGGFTKLHDNTVPFFLWYPATTTAPTYMAGQFIQTNG